MGHFIFIVLHLIALLFMPVALIVTLPLHLIYGAVARPKRPAGYWAQVRCPWCQELVHKEASVCKHCSKPLTPASQQPPDTRAATMRFKDWLNKPLQ